MKPPRPCLESGCPLYAIPGGSRCPGHHAEAAKNGQRRPGPSPGWRKARAEALRRAGHRCQACGRTEQQARDAGTHLEVHHVDRKGVGAEVHDLDQLRVLCRTPCHTRTFRRERLDRLDR